MLERRKTYLVLTFLLTVAIVGLALLPTQPVTEYATAYPASLYVTVENNGNPVAGLREGNFRLYVDGHLRPFRLEPPETPVWIGLLLEQGGDYGLLRADIDEVMRGFAENASKGNSYALAVFSHDLSMKVDFTREKEKISRTYAELNRPATNESNILDAVFEMLDKMAHLPGRRALIVVGSGIDSFSDHILVEVQRKLQSVNVVVYAVALGSMFRGTDDSYLRQAVGINLRQGEAFLNMLASQSGGHAWFPATRSAYPETMESIMKTIAAQYRLVYKSQASSDGKLHQIEVQAFDLRNSVRTDFSVRVRPGLRLPGDKSGG